MDKAPTAEAGLGGALGQLRDCLGELSCHRERASLSGGCACKMGTTYSEPQHSSTVGGNGGKNATDHLFLLSLITVFAFLNC